MNILYLLPKNILSRCVGHLMSIEKPKFLISFAKAQFVKAYNINMNEAEKSIDEYKSINDLFTRKLKSGVRSIAEASIVHPADSVISQIGQIDNQNLIQAKGKNYSVSDLLKDSTAAEVFKDGFFATYYLCPTDYHRVHSPVEGYIESITHIPGKLWPVNEWSVNKIDQLFCVNERVVVNILSAYGKIAVVFVGATNVGKISLSFDSTVTSNNGKTKVVNHKRYPNPIPIDKGQELGIFHMGSTVVLCGQNALYRIKPSNEWKVFVNKAVKMGQGLI